jgi:hypothetical protein
MDAEEIRRQVIEARKARKALRKKYPDLRKRQIQPDIARLALENLAGLRMKFIGTIECRATRDADSGQKTPTLLLKNLCDENGKRGS